MNKEALGFLVLFWSIFIGLFSLVYLSAKYPIIGLPLLVIAFSIFMYKEYVSQLKLERILHDPQYKRSIE